MAEKTAPPQRRAPDEGSAMIIVLGVTMILVLVASLSVTVAIRAGGSARHSTAWNQALAAAEAGVDDYLARLNKNENYWRELDCSNIAMRRPDVASCGWGAGTARGWAPVPGADRARFHYEAVTTATPVDGTVRLTSTGRVGSTTRSVQTVLRRGGFGEFLYYTVYEQVDPANDATYDGSPRSTAWALANCVRTWWPAPNRHSDCVNIQFAPGDVIKGPLHTNDRIVTGGATRFRGTTTTSWPNCDRPPATRECYHRAEGAAPIFDTPIKYREPIELPENAGDLRQHVDTTLNSEATGCLYTGPTRIKLLSSSATYSTMEVWSPYTRRNLGTRCGDFSSSYSTSRTLTIPHNSLVMVENIPGSGPTPSSNTNGSCTAGSIGGFPIANDWNETLADAKCRYGTLYLEGTLKGRMTMVADNNIIVTDHLRYAGGKTGTDALGLIANNSVKIYHPIKRTTSGDFQDLNRPTGTVFKNAVIHAAILTLQHSFTVQAYDRGASDLGTLYLFGSFAQRYRGPVGTGNGNTGYLKDYEFDTRLRFAPPPYFLDPVRSGWGIKTYGEVPAQ